MDLKAKLSRLDGIGLAPSAGVATPEAHEADPRLIELRRRIDGLASAGLRRPRSPRRRGPRPDTLPAMVRTTAHGSVHVRERSYPLSHRHGTVELERCLRVAPGDIGKLSLDERLGAVDPRRILFLDTETTGLAGGTGTLAFLVGLAYFEGDSLKVEQLLLPEPGEEAPMLRHLLERFAAAECLASFNGKSFDWPLLRTRLTLNRLEAPEAKRHLDVLHCARRVFKFRTSESRLAHLEREVLGFVREDDLPGYEIPATYFRYLRGAHGRGLEPVLTHNLHDLLALATLFGFVGERFAASSVDEDPRDRLGLAHAAARAGDDDRALSFAEQAALDATGRVSADALMLAATVHQKRGNFVRAAEIYEEALSCAAGRTETAALLSLKLSKLYEHRLADPVRALDHARRTETAEGADAHERRVERLVRRLAR